MLKAYFKIGWRNLLRNKGYSFINIGGLALGMGVAILIGLWIWDEVSFNKTFKHYDRIGQVWQFVKFDVEKSAYNTVPIPLAEELRDKYSDFALVSLSSNTREEILSADDKKFLKTGNYVEPAFIEIMSLNILSGSRNGLSEINSIMLSESLAKAMFGPEDPLNEIITISENQSLKVTGVYQDFPASSTFKDMHFLVPWNFLVANDMSARSQEHQWDSNSFLIFAMLDEGRDFEEVSLKITDIRMKRENPPGYKPEFFVHPMSKWHLYSEFTDGKNTGGMIEYVRLFGMIGVFVLILACINFMNLSTARSGKRAKEVGIRKSIGSQRSQVVFQFLAESMLTVFMGFVASLLLVWLALPAFNEVTGKQVDILWSNPVFWFCALTFTVITGLLAGSYPALYLSSFLPVKVLKGTFRASRFAALPRKFLVVLQFTVSITLIIGIIVVFRQIEFAKSRSIGYNRSGLIEVPMNSPQLYSHFDALRNELLRTGAVYEMSQSSGSVTVQYGGTTNVSWQGKDPAATPLLMSNQITHEYGKTIGWEVAAGRDFSREFSTDSTSMILNESAVSLMALKDPLNEVVKWGGKEYKVIGVVKDMIKESPFEPVKPSFFVLDYESVSVINIRLASHLNVHESLARVEDIVDKYSPGLPFDYNFVDEAYEQKFSTEERIGTLSGFFAILSTFISMLGMFGLASFMAEQRTKEVGIKKVLGASVFQLWQMLSKEFVLLVLISVSVSTPIAYYFMHNWLLNYEYRTEISWWIFLAAITGTLAMTILTVSFHALKAALMNPVKSLRSE